MYNQRQSNGYDCGIFAVAFALSLIDGENPCNITYDSKKLRRHFKQCLINGKFTKFPVVPHRGVTDRTTCYSKQVEVFCSCRRPAKMLHGRDIDRKEEMARCDGCQEWYHQGCEKIPPNIFEDPTIEWHCQFCVTPK